LKYFNLLRFLFTYCIVSDTGKHAGGGSNCAEFKKKINKLQGIEMFSGDRFRREGGPICGPGRGALRQRVLTRLLGAAAIGVALMPATTGGVRGDVPEKIYIYSINHPTHGDIGTYKNTILDDGARIAVNNEIQVQVKILLIVAHQEMSKSKEIWKNGRLISFSGETQENGKKTVVTGEADGSKFVVEAPDGQKDAPASVFPNNPWSRAILKATVLLGTKSGKLYQVHALPSEKREVTVNGRSVMTDYVRVEGDAEYELWFDERGVAVKFTEIDKKKGVITFILKSEAVQPASAAAKSAPDKG
jgi:Domain of unknown function (DUF6134)